jgi:RNA polymerase sigma-70 factor, ECF subfamily
VFRNVCDPHRGVAAAYAQAMGESAGVDEDLLARLVIGDESAFTDLIERYHPRLLRLASSFVARRDVAEDVVQETWIAVLNGIGGFQGRSAFRTWLFQICVNKAKSAAVREQRVVPVDPADLEIDADFAPDGSWAVAPQRWADQVSEQTAGGPLVERVQCAIEALPAGQRQVLTLRDVEGLSAAEVSAVLSITDVNQRVLLHRGRRQVRRSVEGTVQR